MKKSPIHIVGGGLVGSLAALFFAKHAYPVTLYERRPDMRKVDISAGRSINLVVTSRGLNALEKVGLKDAVLDIAIAMKGRMLHDIDSSTQLVPYGQHEGEVIHAVSRGLLNKLLLEAADHSESIDIAFHRRCTDYNIDHKTLTFLNEDTAEHETVTAEIAIGTDGAWSAMRKAMLDGGVENFNYSQDFLEYGYKELVIPPTEDGGFRLEKDALHIWPRKDFMLIALPNIDGSFTCTLFLAYEGEQSFANLQTKADVQRFFETQFADTLPHMPTLLEDFFENPTGSMVTVKCAPWHVGSQSMLLGDAAHAIVPFFGQGMNCGFEDCTALGELLDNHAQPDWESFFSALQTMRKPNSDAIADMALENFVEMRDTTSDKTFQLKKDIGFELERRYPGQFTPRYSMVVFHPEISYEEAYRKGKIQDEILDALSVNISSVEEVDWNKADQLMNQLATRLNAA